VKDQPEGDEQVIRGIIQQCIKYPDRKDTIEGILKWWLPEGRVEWRKEEVQKAFDLLVSKGWLTKRGTVPSKEIYGINKDRLQEIRSFLQHSDASP
jgi:hypothetical protein